MFDKPEIFIALRRMLAPRAHSAELLSIAERIDNRTEVLRKQREERHMGVEADDVLDHSAHVLMNGKGQ